MPPDENLPIWVAAVALVNGREQVLVQQRRMQDAHGDLWEFPGGKLEPEESARAAAVREIAEELGVSIDPLDLRPVTFAITQTEGKDDRLARELTILLFACTKWRGEPQANAAQALAWCDPAQLASWPMPPLDYPLALSLRKLLEESAI